jgi:hypothetical protein
MSNVIPISVKANPGRKPRYLQPVTVNAPDRDTTGDNLALLERIRANLEAEINAIKNPAPDGMWLVWRGKRPVNRWEETKGGKVQVREKKCPSVAKWHQAEAAREQRNKAKARLSEIEELLYRWSK